MKRNIKKTIVLLLALMLGITILAGCGGGSLSGKYSLKEIIQDGETRIYEDYLNEVKEYYEQMKAYYEENGEEYDEEFNEGDYESYIEFKSDGKYVMAFEGETMEGTYKVSGKNVTINPPEEYEDEDSEPLVGKIDGKKITFENGSTTMVYEKK